MRGLKQMFIKQLVNLKTFCPCLMVEFKGRAGLIYAFVDWHKTGILEVSERRCVN